MGLKEDIAKLITDASTAIGKPMIEGADFDIIHQPLKHKPVPLQKGKIAVYTFYYNGDFLKIGQSVDNSRYQSNHYTECKGQSRLANSIKADQKMMAVVGNSRIDDWIKNNCERYDVLIDASKHDKMTLNFVEGLLHYYYKPKYEK
ncbi:MAG: hypothetical protein SPI51_00755 [Candidatus Enterosoma sp.]|nr:hypothetical protein [Candidatus Enterosoma sp.]